MALFVSKVHCFISSSPITTGNTSFEWKHLDSGYLCARSDEIIFLRFPIIDSHFHDDTSLHELLVLFWLVAQ